MLFNPFRKTTSPMRAHVINVTGTRVAGAAAERFAVLAGDPGQALAAVIASLGPCDIAEITGEMLAPTAAASLDLEPGRPLRVS